MKPTTALILAALLIISAAVANADLGCPNDNHRECKEHCQQNGKEGKCEKRWYRWKYQWRCKCDPCRGMLIGGACITKIPNVGVNCQTDPWKCQPSG